MDITHRKNHHGTNLVSYYSTKDIVQPVFALAYYYEAPPTSGELVARFLGLKVSKMWSRQRVRKRCLGVTVNGRFRTRYIWNLSETLI